MNLYGSIWKAQTFTVGTTGSNETFKVTHIKLKFDGEASPGEVTVGIRAVDGEGKPDGDDLAVGYIDGNSLPKSGYETIVIGLNKPCILNANTQYAIVVRAVDGDSDNEIWWTYNDSNPYSGGQYWTSDDSGESWTNEGAGDWDFFFEVWGFKTSKTEYYTENDDNYDTIENDHPTFQTFTIGNIGANQSQSINEVNLKLSKANSPETIRLIVKSASSNIPTGSNLGYWDFSADDIPTGSAEWVKFNLSPPLQLSASSTYALIVSSSAESPDSFVWRGDFTSPTYAGGNAGYSNDTGSTWETYSADFMFEVWAGQEEQGEHLDWNIPEETPISISGSNYYAQTFTVGSVGQNKKIFINRIRVPFWPSSSADPYPDMVYSIRAIDTSSGLPTGSDLVTGRIFPNHFSEYAWKDVFIDNYALETSTPYALIFSQPEATGDSLVYWATEDATSSYTGGAIAESTDSGSSWSLIREGEDAYFDIWGLPGDFSYSGSSSFTLTPNVSLSLEKSYNGVNSINFAPSIDVDLEKEYSGDVPISLTPSYETSLLVSYSGEVTLTLTPSNETTFGLEYDGAVSLTLTPSHSTSIEMTYEGTNDLTLLPSHTSELVTEYSGNLPLTLTSSYETTLTVSIDGDINLTLTPSIEEVVDWIYSGTNTVSLTPASYYYLAFNNYDYPGEVAINITPSSTRIIEREYAGSISVTITPSYTKVVEKEYSGAISLTLTPSNELIADVVINITNTVTLLPTSSYSLISVDREYTGVQTINITPSSVREVYRTIGRRTSRPQPAPFSNINIKRTLGWLKRK